MVAEETEVGEMSDMDGSLKLERNIQFMQLDGDLRLKERRMREEASVEILRNALDAAAWRFERIYGAFPGRNVTADGNAVVARSAKRYIELLNEG